MSNVNTSGKGSGGNPTEVGNLPQKGEGLKPAETELNAECERLRHRVEQLEEESVRDRQLIATLQAERENYERSLLAWAGKQVTEEDVQRYAQEAKEALKSFANGQSPGMTFDEILISLTNTSR